MDKIAELAALAARLHQSMTFSGNEELSIPICSFCKEKECENCPYGKVFGICDSDEEELPRKLSHWEFIFYKSRGIKSKIWKVL